MIYSLLQFIQKANKQALLPFFIVLIFFFSTSTIAQSVKKYNKLISKNEWVNFRKVIDKDLKKIPQNPILQYFLSIYFFKQDSTAIINLDSAHNCLISAQKNYKVASYKIRKDWQKQNFSENMVFQKQRYVDSLAFSITKTQHQLSGYQYFIERFEGAKEITEAIALRNEVAYWQAFLNENPDSMKSFIDHYPEALQIHEARQRYETLLFEKQTANETLEEFQEFIIQNPESPYRKLAEQSIFQLATLFHTPETYLDFIRRFPDNAFIPVARQWFYNLILERDEDYFKNHPSFLQDNDWSNIVQNNEMMLYPILEDEKYGFMNSEGKVMIAPSLDSVVTDYFCEGITENYIKFFKNEQVGLMDKTGKEITKPVFQSIEDFEAPLLKTKKENLYGIIHETGFEVLAPLYDSVKTLGNKLLEVYKSNKTLLFSCNGRKLAEFENMSVESFDDSLMIFQQSGKYALYTQEALFKKQSLSLDFQYDLAEITSDRNLRLIKDSTEWLYLSGYNLAGGWLDTTHLLPERLKLEKEFEEVNFTGNFFIVRAKNGKVGLFEKGGKKILNTKYQEIVVWKDGLFKIKLNDKYGITDKTEKTIVKPEYDGLENLGNNYLTTLKNGKFGLITLNKKVLIQPQYESIIRQYDPLQKYFIARQEEKFGLIDTKNELVTDFLFDEVIYWQPSVALVRISEFWHLYDIPEKRFIFKPLAEIVFQKVPDNELVIRVMEDSKYGLFSNKKGILANAEYDAFTNIGTPEKPFYIAEKYLREVNVYLLYYINGNGKTVHRQVLTQELYEKIACE
jgi:hypothetical protein